MLQKLTTREPDLDQLEVAIASLRAVMTAEQLAEVDARVGSAASPRSRPPSDRGRDRPRTSTLPAMSNLQLHVDRARAARRPRLAEPLVAGGVRCHGGFDADGELRLAAHEHRVPAIEAWQQSHREQFGTEILDVPLELWPEVFPNVAQSKYLLARGRARADDLDAHAHRHRRGLRLDDPRACNVDDAAAHFDESSTAPRSRTSQRGLFEAHARDEAGWEDEGGPQADVVRGARHRVRAPGHRRHDADDARAHGHRARRRHAADAGGDRAATRKRCAASPTSTSSLEMMLRRMVGLLFIEVSAFHTFAWAEEVLVRHRPRRRRRRRRRLVRYIRADETPHVDYLRTALTEMRDRTFVGESGRSIPGTEVIGTLWDAALEQSLGAEPRELRAHRDRRGRARARGATRAATRSSRASTLGSGDRRSRAHEVRHLLRAPAARGRGTDDSEHRLIQDALEQIELADRSASTTSWEVEHHFLEEYSHSSAPEVFLAAASQRTQAHPARARHRADAAAVQPPGPHRRAHRDARPRVGRPRRLRHRRVVVGGRARRLHDRPRATSARCGRRACASRCAA